MNLDEPFFYIGRDKRYQHSSVPETFPFAMRFWKRVVSSETGAMTQRSRPRAVLREAIEALWSPQERQAETVYQEATGQRARMFVSLGGGQFYVHKQRVLLHSHAFYRRLFDVLNGTAEVDPIPGNSWARYWPVHEWIVFGSLASVLLRRECEVLERSWHFLFGEPERPEHIMNHHEWSEGWGEERGGLQLTYDTVRFTQTAHCTQAVLDGHAQLSNQTFAASMMNCHF